MPFNVIPLVNTCHALGFSACLMLDALISFSRGGNRAGWVGLSRANSGPGQNRAGPKLARFFRAKILIAQPTLKIGPVEPNSLFKAKKNYGRPGRAKFCPVFFWPII